MFSAADVRFARWVKAIGRLWRQAGVLAFVLAGLTLLAAWFAEVETDRRVECLIAACLEAACGGYVRLVGTRLRALSSDAPMLAIVPLALGLLAFPVGTVVGAAGLYLVFCKTARRVLSPAYREFEAIVRQSDSPSAPPTDDYVTRHIQGQLSLPVSFWINGMLGAIALTGLMRVFGKMVLRALEVTSGAALDIRLARWTAVLLYVVAALALYAWGAVGTWRSARRSAGERGRKRVWSVLARASILLPLASVLFTFQPLRWAQVAEVWQLAWDGRDQLGVPRLISKHAGETLQISGVLGTGSALKVTRYLEQAKSVRAIALDCAGGRLLEAQGIAIAIRGRGLDTIAEGECVSACTFVFLAGRERLLGPNGRLGFHRASIAPGIEAPFELIAPTYRNAGISEAFITRIGQTSAANVWYPTAQELIQNHIVTRILDEDRL